MDILANLIVTFMHTEVSVCKERARMKREQIGNLHGDVWTFKPSRLHRQQASKHLSSPLWGDLKGCMLSGRVYFILI